MYIGKVMKDKDATISNMSPNKSIVISGISGSGKSERIKDIEKHLIQKGTTLMVMDFDDTHPFLEGDNINWISAVKDRLEIILLKPEMLYKSKEQLTNYIGNLAESLLTGTVYGDRQLGILRDALRNALKRRANYGSDFEAIIGELELMGTERAMGVKEKLWPVTSCNIFDPHGKKLVPGAINIISFSGINNQAKKAVVEILMRVFWLGIRSQYTEGREYGFKIPGDVVFVVDEFQNLGLQKTSTVFEMLREGRKYRISLILATQTLVPFSTQTMAAISQAAVRLYFRPATCDVMKIAKQINPNNVEKTNAMLKNLRIGEAIAVGDFEIAKRLMTRPIITYTDFAESETRKMEKLRKNGGRN